MFHPVIRKYQSPIYNIMYIRILTIVALAICLWSCSSEQDEPFVPESKGIAFGGNNGTWQDAPISRGTSGLETLFTTFRVWGYKTTATDAVGPSAPQLVMDGYKVEYSAASTGSTATNTTGWEYVGINNPNLSSAQSIKFWDYSATSYRFFGYSPFETKATTTATGTAGESKSISFPFAYSDQATAKSIPYISELWYNNSSYGNCVTLTFAPIIAKVRFKFTYPKNTKSIDLRDIQFCDSRFIADPSSATTPLRGNIVATYPITGEPSSKTPTFSWSPSTSEGSTEASTGALIFTTPYEEESDAIHILNDPKLYGKWYYVPPMSMIPFTQGPYTISATIDGNPISTTVPEEFMQWKAGYQYTYIFKITEAGTIIAFSNLQVEEWRPGTNIENQGSGTAGW